MLPVNTMSLPRLRLELPGLLDGIARQHRGVRPLGIGHGRGHHVLGDLVQVARDAGGVIALAGPVAAEILERPTPDKQRIGLGILSLRLGDQILVRELGVEPVAEHLDGAVHGDILSDHELSHEGVDLMRTKKSSA